MLQETKLQFCLLFRTAGSFHFGMLHSEKNTVVGYSGTATKERYLNLRRENVQRSWIKLN